MNATPGRPPDHQGDSGSPPVAALGGEIGDLVKSTGDEVGELHLGHRSHPHQRGADGCPHDGRFTEGRVHHTLFPN